MQHAFTSNKGSTKLGLSKVWQWSFVDSPDQRICFEGRDTTALPSLCDWQVTSCTSRQLKKLSQKLSHIWAPSAHVRLTLSTYCDVLSDTKLLQLMGEFTPDSNYTPGLFSFAQLSDIPLTAGGVCALEAPLWVNFYCSDWLSSPLSSVAARKWGLIVFHLRGELVEYFCFRIQSDGIKKSQWRKDGEIHTSVSITA